MKRNILLAVIAAALLSAMAGSTAEAGRRNYGNPRPYVQNYHHGSQWRNTGWNSRRQDNNFRTYRSRNNFGNGYYNPYQFGRRNYGSNNPGLYFRF